MFRVSLLPTRPLGLCGLGLIAAFAGAPSAYAADIDDDPPPYARRYDPPPYRAPDYAAPPPVRRWSEREPASCRVVHRRAVDQDGREVVRRLRVCDEGVVEYRPGWVARGPRHYDDGRRFDAPRYEAPPRPPRSVGPDYRGPDYRTPDYRGPDNRGPGYDEDDPD